MISIGPRHASIKSRPHLAENCQLECVRPTHPFGRDPTAVSFPLPYPLQHFLARPLESVKPSDKGPCHRQQSLSGAFRDCRLMPEELDREELAQMRASLVQRGRSEGRVSFADELESAEEQDVDDRDVVVLGEGRFERLDDGELDLGSVCRFISPSAWLMHVVTVAESRRLKEKEQFGRRTLASVGRTAGCRRIPVSYRTLCGCSRAHNSMSELYA